MKTIRKTRAVKAQKKRTAIVNTGYVEYDSNNSGGSWWLKDKDWLALEKAGWEVEWGGKYFCHSKFASFSKKPDHKPEPCKSDKGCPGHRRFDSASEMTKADSFLGALAQRAIRRGLSLREAADEWERITGMSATDAGCACCGQPHRFTEYDANGKYKSSGPEAEYVASW